MSKAMAMAMAMAMGVACGVRDNIIIRSTMFPRTSQSSESRAQPDITLCALGSTPMYAHVRQCTPGVRAYRGGRRA